MCGRNRFQVLRWAKRAARARGIDVGSFDRLLVYQRCPGQARAEALAPGTVSWYYGNVETEIAVHELGHNLGLLHATRTTCRRQGEHSMFRGRCRPDTYGDYSRRDGRRGPQRRVQRRVPAPPRLAEQPRHRRTVGLLGAVRDTGPCE